VWQRGGADVKCSWQHLTPLAGRQLQPLTPRWTCRRRCVAPTQGHNSFLRKNLNGLLLSAEPGNLYNKHSFKYSGACWQAAAGHAAAARSWGR
jgi:hypothetical protein